MNLLPESLKELIEALRELPGIGLKTAERLAFFLLRRPDSANQRLAKILNDFRKSIYYCTRCFNFTDREGLCQICRDSSRNPNLICVVSNPLEASAIENTGDFIGTYHILHGEISPLDDIGPSDLKIPQLISRAKKLPPSGEIIIATNPSIEGEATAQTILKQLVGLKIKTTRLARGLPTGGSLEYADEYTLKSALQNRTGL